jgi:hypothetical protein
MPKINQSNFFNIHSFTHSLYPFPSLFMIENLLNKVYLKYQTRYYYLKLGLNPLNHSEKLLPLQTGSVQVY